MPTRSCSQARGKPIHKRYPSWYIKIPQKYNSDSFFLGKSVSKTFCSRLCFFRRRHMELLSELSWSSSCQCRGALKCSSDGDGFPAPPPASTVTEREGQNSDKMRVDYIWANCFLLWRQSRRSEVENGDVKQVTQTFCLVQVVYVVVVTGWRWQAKERREHWGWKREIHETYYRELRSGTLQRGIN